MQRLYLTLPTPAENVALDEALLDWAEENAAGATDAEVLRIWESLEPMVVAGRSSRLEQEIDVAECTRRGIPILRRSSGGAAIVAGPGCLMYAVILSFAKRPELRDITRAHQFVLGRIFEGLNRYCPTAKCAGTSDLVIGSTNADCSTQSEIRNQKSEILKKFSGNSLRVKRTHLLYHGTLLYDFDIALITQCLKTPPRQPSYRNERSHSDFVANLPLDRQQLIEAIDVAFLTTRVLKDVPVARAKELVATRFACESWNREFG